MIICCAQCGGPIESRARLAVVGRALRPLHRECQAAYATARPWYRRPGPPVNRWGSLFRFNLLLLPVLLLVAAVIPERTAAAWQTVLLLLLAANAWLLLARVISYLSVERHLPPGHH